MKLLKLTLIIFSLIAITALHSCKPEPPDPIKQTDLGFFGLGAAKDYAYFKKGTWWVYQNTKTGLYDTIEVYYSLLDTLEQKSTRWKFKNELFDVESKSLSNGYRYAFYMRSLSAEVTDFKWGCAPVLERSNPYEGELTPFYYPFDLWKDKDGFCINIKDTMTINNIEYKDVAIFYIISDGTEPLPLKHNAAKYYWARNYGLIRKDLFESKFQGDTTSFYHSWQLVESNIIQ